MPPERRRVYGRARDLDEAAVPYAIIRGVALQVHQREPRTTLDIDLAVPSVETPVQFTDDPVLAHAITRADEIEVEGTAQALLEADPTLASELTPEEQALLDRLPR